MILIQKKIKLFFYMVFVFCLCVVFAPNSSTKEKKPKEKRVKYVKPKGWLAHLLSLNKERGDMDEELKLETEHYRDIKKAIDRKELKVGENGAKVEKEYGQPTVKLIDNDKIHTRWVYKPGDASYFAGEKIYLFFDPENKLTSWDQVEAKPEKEEEDKEDEPAID